MNAYTSDLSEIQCVLLGAGCDDIGAIGNAAAAMVSILERMQATITSLESRVEALEEMEDDSDNALEMHPPSPYAL